MSKKFMQVVAVCLVLFRNYVFAIQRHMICKNVQDTFTLNGESGPSSNPAMYQGPAGKKGPPGSPGIRGMRGSKGTPGFVNHTRIDDLIDLKVASVFTELINRTEELEEEVRNLANMLRSMDGWAECQSSDCCSVDGFTFAVKCYKIFGLGNSDSFIRCQACSLCAAKGMALAEFNNQTELQAVQGFLTKSVPSASSGNYIWIGMTHSNSTMWHRSGKGVAANQFQWYAGYPSESDNVSYIVMYAGIISPIWSYGSTSSRSLKGVLCEYRIR